MKVGSRKAEDGSLMSDIRPQLPAYSFLIKNS